MLILSPGHPPMLQEPFFCHHPASSILKKTATGGGWQTGHQYKTASDTFLAGGAHHRPERQTGHR